ncbi:MAG: hypothetical protein GC172_08355 [Phycisphaera sp.]|nr:hypothetical protein [Phycisphaera sp.]
MHAPRDGSMASPRSLVRAALVGAALAWQASAGAQTQTPVQARPQTQTPRAEPSAAAQPRKDAPRDERERARAEAQQKLDLAALPQPMSEARFTAFLKAVDPALAANAELAASYAAYRESADAAIKAASGRIRDRLPAAYRFDGAREIFVPRHNPELVQTLVLREAALARLAAAERTLLVAVERAADPARRLAFVGERVDWLAERLPRDGLLPSTKLTLFELVARLELSSEVAATIEPVLVAHAEQLGTLLAKRADILSAGDLARARIETEAGSLWRYGLEEPVRATEARLAEVDDAEFASELAIRDLHFESLRRLRGRLPAREGRRLVEEWQRSVHPELFDDERLLAELVESMLGLPASAPGTDEAILEAVDLAFRRVEPLARDASAAADLILPRLVDRSDLAVLEELAARIRLLEIQAKRRAAVRDAVARVRGVVATGDDAVAARFTQLLETIGALERADQFDRSSHESLAAQIAAAIAAAAERSIDTGGASSAPSAP